MNSKTKKAGKVIGKISAQLWSFLLYFRKMWISFRDFVKDEGFFLTASVSYYAILSLIPIAIIGTAFYMYLYSLGFADASFSDFLSYIKNFFPQIPPDLEKNIEFVFNHRSAMGYIGIFILIWAATLVFSSLGNALDKIFKTGEKKRFRRHIFSLTLVFIVAFSTVLFIIGENILRAYIRGITLKSALEVSIGGIFSSFIIPPFVYALFASFIYYTLPSRRVQGKCIIAGAVTSAVVWEIGRSIFVWYMTHITKVNIIYGSFGVLIIGVLWVYYSFAVLFWGAELAYRLELDKIDKKNKMEVVK